MGRLKVHQFVPSFGPRDAVGNHTLAVHRVLERAKIAGGVWADGIAPSYDGMAKRYPAYARSPGTRFGRNVILYQLATAGRGVVEFVLARPEPKTMSYHNITPAHFFEPYDTGVTLVLAEAREELKRLTAQMDVALADSEYNAQELRELGVPDVRVVPPYFPATIDVSPSPSIRHHLRLTKRGLDLLFVGRVVPNKGHHHLLRAFAVLRRAIDPGARLFIAGTWGPSDYMRELFRLRERLGAEGVAFTGPVSDEGLVALYEAADVLLCLSEHEGFGVPLVEAMGMGVPVVAYDAGAVAETMGGAGVVMRTLDPVVVAEVVAKVGSDDVLRRQILRRQRERVAEIESAPREQVLLDVVRRVGEKAGS